jgi:antitoxin component YwqK of YwqJK toxin-antitoxin module
MRKYLLTIGLLLYCSLSFAQINIEELVRVEGIWTKKGDSKPYNGDFKETFDNGSTKGTGTFLNGQLEGLRVQFYPNGKKKTEKEYKGSYPHGKSKEFYENGTLKQEGEFEDNKEHGTWTLYHINGQKKAVLTFVHGVQTGPYFEYDEQGT